MVGQMGVTHSDVTMIGVTIIIQKVSAVVHLLDIVIGTGIVMGTPIVTKQVMTLV